LGIANASPPNGFAAANGFAAPNGLAAAENGFDDAPLALGPLEGDAGPADLDLVAWLDAALVDAGAVHERAGLVAQVDEGDVLGRRDLDDRVHARRLLVVDAEMALRVLAQLDDVVGHRLTPHERIVLVERERQSDLLLAFHVTAFPSRRTPRVNGSRSAHPSPGDARLELAGHDTATASRFPEAGRM
jgi:hypothetical protein